MITSYKKNLNTNYRVKIDSALQTSKNYIQLTKPNDDLSYTNSLSTNFNLEGYNINKLDDRLKVSLNFYQTNQENEDSKTIPTVLPNVKYFSGYNNRFGNISNSTIEFYNIFREKSTLVHAKKQQKVSHKYILSKQLVNYNSKILMNAEIYNQLFNTENKLIDENIYKTGTYYRIFPILGISTETPFKNKNFLKSVTFNPKLNLVISPGISNNKKISNEDATNNDFSMENIYRLSRYSGNDKTDHSKRITYGISAFTEVVIHHYLSHMNLLIITIFIKSRK